MAQFFNQYSFVVSSGLLLVILGIILLRSKQRARAGLVMLAALLGVGLSWLALRPVASSYASAAEVRALIGSGKPVLIEFQSPF